MKNKKSKIIIPAMGLILLSTAASISGSVAWFTASRTAKFDAGEFAVVKTSENLAYDLTNGQNTTVGDSGTDHESIQFANTNALTHASYDHKNHNILEAKEDGSGLQTVHALTSVSAPTESALQVTGLGTYSQNEPHYPGYVYAAAIWQIDFKLSFGPNQKNVGLFIDWSKTGMAIKHTFAQGDAVAPGTYFKDILLTNTNENKVVFEDNDGNNETTTHIIAENEAGTYYTAPTATGKGFRIAFMPLEGEDSQLHGVDKVLAKNQTSALSRYLYAANGEKETYEHNMLDVVEQVPVNGTEYVANDHDLLASDTVATLPTAGTTTVAQGQALNSYLGLFPFQANSISTLSYLCVAWYDGTDPEIQNRANAEEYEKITSELAFEAFDLL